MTIDLVDNTDKDFGFSSSGRYVVWLQENEILPNPTVVDRNFNEESARRRGFNDYKECHRQDSKIKKISKESK